MLQLTGTDTLTLAADTVADSGTFNIGASAAGVTITAVTASDYETLTINSSGGANTITTLTANDITSLTITGSTALTITNAIASATGLGRLMRQR